MTEKSEKSLKEKLGFTAGMSTLFLKAPAEYFTALGYRSAPYDDVDGEYDFIHAFYTSLEDLSSYADILISKLSEVGTLWISWPNMSSAPDIRTDITEPMLREILAPTGLVDVEVCIVTKSWLGMKFVWRKQ